MKILDYNELRNATITASSANDLFPVDNLYDRRRVKSFAFTGNTSENFVIYQAGMSFSSAILDSHNLTSSATVKFQANTSDSWATPAVDVTLSIADTICYCWATTQAYDYFRVLIEDPTNTEPVKIGMFFLAQAKTIDIRDGFTLTDYNIGRSIYRVADLSSPYFVNFTDLKEFLERTAGTIQLSASRQQNGTAWPFYVIIKEDDLTSYLPIYGLKFGSIAQNKIEAHTAFTFPFSVEEVN